MKTVFVTGADRGIGFCICEEFIRHGWRVIAGQYMPEWKELELLKGKYPDQIEVVALDVGSDASVRMAAQRTAELTDKLDMLINCAGIAGKDNRESGRNTLNINTMGPIRMVEAFMGLMQRGEKRLCFVSSEAGSITLAHRKDSIAYCTSKTCLNMAVRLMFEQLKTQGYRFWLYHPGWVRSYMLGYKTTNGNFDPEETAQVAYRQFTSDRAWEDTLVMSDVSDELWAF